MYMVDDDPQVNEAVEICRALFVKTAQRLHRQGFRLEAINSGMLFSLIESGQVPNTPMDPLACHMFCDMVHVYADLVIDAKLTPEEKTKWLADHPEDVVQLIGEERTVH